MKKQTKPILNQICLWLGIGILAAAVIVLICWQWSTHSAQKKAQSYVQTIRTIIPEPQTAVPEERRDNTMSVLSIDGTDFIGILEMPQYDASVPVCADWGEVTKYPCRLNGSVYDRTIQIGTTSQKGQFDFYREISVGDAVFFTDMEGNRYHYEVIDIRYEKHADQAALRQEEADLTLFVKNIFAFEYIILFCDVVG